MTDNDTPITPETPGTPESQPAERTPPPPTPPPPAGEVPKAARQLALFCHISTLAGIFIPIVGNLVPPLILWLLWPLKVPIVSCLVPLAPGKPSMMRSRWPAARVT